MAIEAERVGRAYGGTLDSVPAAAAAVPAGAISLSLGTLIAGTLAASAIASFMAEKSWGVADYNYWMDLMYRTIKDWDTQGWKSKCWEKNPSTRVSWVSFMTRFGDFYGKHGQVKVYVSDVEEEGAKLLLGEMKLWAAWIGLNCKTDLSPSPFDPNKPEPAAEESSLLKYFKWAAIGFGSLAILNIVMGIRSVLPSPSQTPPRALPPPRSR